MLPRLLAMRRSSPGQETERPPRDFQPRRVWLAHTFSDRAEKCPEMESVLRVCLWHHADTPRGALPD